MSAPLRRDAAARVLVTTDAVGGVWTYSLDLARGLAAKDVATVLAVMGPSPSADQLEQVRAIPGLSLIDTGLPLDWTAADEAGIIEAGAAVRDLAATFEADLVHLNSPALAAAGRFPAPVVGACHSCLATWWTAVKDGPLPEDFAWRTRLLRRGMLACDALIAPTRAFAEATAGAYGVRRLQVVWNGREPPAAAAAPAREPIVLTSGRLWDEGKNLALLDAAAGLASTPVLAAGPLAGPNGARLELRHVQPLGRLSPAEMAAWLRRAPVYATAARYEPFGLGVLEAAQAGCALVLSNIPTLRELWDGAAVFVPTDDAGGFARAFERLAGNAGDCARLGARARARATRYSVDGMTAGALAVYRQVQPRLALREAAA